MCRSSSVLFALAITLTGCDSRPTLVVDARSDLVPGREVTRLSIAVSTPSEEDVPERRRDLTDDDDLIAGVRVAEMEGLRPLQYLLVAEAWRGEELVLRQGVLVPLESSRAVTVLLTRDCVGVTCPGAADSEGHTSCRAGRCVDPRCTEESPERCPEPVCGSDAECAARGTCGVGRCVGGACVVELVDERCAADHYCDSTGACVGVAPPAPDAGLRDGGPACGAGFADCDGDLSDGCEDLSSPMHCGACGVECVDPTPVCASTGDGYACATGCGPGEALCGGACVDTGGSPLHCGGCGVSCDDGNPCTTDSCSSGVCSNVARAGACTGGTCVAGTCCTGCVSGGVCRAGTSASACGAGGGSCTSCAGSTPLCVAGACAECAISADCGDGNVCTNDYCIGGSCSYPPNSVACTGGRCAGGSCCTGCVSSGTCYPGTTTTRCGTAGATCAACSPPHATGICSTGACEIGSCSGYFEDCNGAPADGCEVDRTMYHDCATCGIDCSAIRPMAMHVQSWVCSLSNTCLVGSCDMGWYNCDLDHTNGCESSTSC